MFTAIQDFSPFNVVAWHGNYVPYKVGVAYAVVGRLKLFSSCEIRNKLLPVISYRVFAVLVII